MDSAPSLDGETWREMGEVIALNHRIVYTIMTKKKSH